MSASASGASKVDGSNTAKKQSKPHGKGRPFVKGDPRINRLGRPKSHDQLRELIQTIATEAREGGETRIMDKLRRMFESKDPRDSSQLLEHGWGKVPQDLNVNVKDVDAAIKRELDRMAGRGQTEDAGTAEADADASETEAGSIA